MTAYRGTIIAFRRDLLGSRLINMLRAWQVARSVDYELVVLWPDKTPFLPGSYDFFDIFDREALATEHPDLRVVATYDPDVVSEACGLTREELKAAPDTIAAFGADGQWDPGIRVAIHRSTAVPQVAKAALGEFHELFASLPFHPRVAEAIQAVEPAEIGYSTAIHLRRGDFINGRVIREDGVVQEGLFALSDLSDTDLLQDRINNYIMKYVPLSTICRICQKIPKVILFSDVSEDRRSLEHEFGNRLLDVHGALDAFSDLTPLQRAFCELVLMSRTGQILATKSNFSSSAAEIGAKRVIRAQKWMRAEEVIHDAGLHLENSGFDAEGKAMVLREIVRGYEKDFRRRGVEAQAAVCEQRRRELEAGPSPIVPASISAKTPPVAAPPRKPPTKSRRSSRKKPAAKLPRP